LGRAGGSAECATTLEIAMHSFAAHTSACLLPTTIALLAIFVTPAQANYFHDTRIGVERMIGSAPNPTLNDLRDIYPVESQSMNEHGQVDLKLSLTQKGTVSGAVVEKSSGSPRLDEAAIKYVKAYYSYEPPDGQEMPSQMLFTVNFVLR
jgi:TonB family protein